MTNINQTNDCVQEPPPIDTGLRGTVIASTKISDVDGEKLKLIYRGFPIKDLAENATFEEVVYLLLFEKLPGKEELKDITQKLKTERYIPEGILEALKYYPKESLPMDVLQSAAGMLAGFDPDKLEKSFEGSIRMAIRLISKFSTVLAAWQRIRSGLEPVRPDSSLSHAANFLYMLNNEKPSDEVASFFDACLIMHAEHSFNASTFASREVASTRAHMYASVAAGLGSLSGELHGGANTRVMEMLLKIGGKENTDKFISDTLESGGLIMGLGHAVYKGDDPRALIIKPMSKRMGELAGQPEWYELSEYLEKQAKAFFKEKKGRDIYVNIDFYSASLYYTMGIQTDLFTSLFAISRIAGWTAHVIEEQFGQAAPKPMLYRPSSRYIGEYCGPDECIYKDVDDRH